MEADGRGMPSAPWGPLHDAPVAGHARQQRHGTCEVTVRPVEHEHLRNELRGTEPHEIHMILGADGIAQPHTIMIKPEGAGRASLKTAPPPPPPAGPEFWSALKKNCTLNGPVRETRRRGRQFFVGRKAQRTLSPTT